MQLADGTLHLAGGLMMGSALVLLHFMLRRREIAQGESDAGNREKWMVLLGFFLGVPLGVYVLLQLVGPPASGILQNVLVGLFLGASLTYVLARRPMRQ